MNYHYQNTLLIIFLVLVCVPILGQTASVHVTVESISGNEGELVLGIFNNEADFKKKTNPFQVAKVILLEKTISFTFSNLPLNNYAVAAFHDANSDGKLNTKSMKIPTEGVGISGKMPKMRTPKFEETAFQLSEDTTILIQMVYPVKP